MLFVTIDSAAPVNALPSTSRRSKRRDDHRLGDVLQYCGAGTLDIQR